jgi:hypothetical protein
VKLRQIIHSIVVILMLGIFSNAQGSTFYTTPTDTLFTKVFEDEGQLALFVYDYLNLYQNDKALSMDSDQFKDSLFQALNTNKSILLPKHQFSNFISYSLQEGSAKPILSQVVDAMPRSINNEYSIVVEKGDQILMNFSLLKGVLKSTQISLQYNQLRIKDFKLKSKKQNYQHEFTASENGKFTVVVKNFGWFRVQGLLDVQLISRKKYIQCQAFKVTKTYKVNQEIISYDTLYQSLVDENITLSHQSNILQNFTKEIPMITHSDQQLLGFGVFMYPTHETEPWLLHRSEVFREDPLEDFSKKELLGNSLTLLKEFELKDIDLMVYTTFNSGLWKNGELINPYDFTTGFTQKKNYVFIKTPGDAKKYFVKVTNRSKLYEHDLGLKILGIYLNKFRVRKDVDVVENEEFIYIKLL